VVRQVAPTRATVLILGESGTGKELIAKAVHQLSPRRARPMVTVHCAALSPTLLESELFGHEKGAFTGAHERRIGRFELAEGGTLFLDEVGEIDANTQVKLLRFLGERTFERVGSNKTLTSDVRLLAATNKNLAAQVKIGAFREDLFFRLRVVEIQLPPLRERRSDIPLLAETFMKESARANGKTVNSIAPEAMAALMNYAWPGNVRELSAAIEGAVVLCRSQRITPRELPANVRHNDATSVGVDPASALLPAGTVREAEKQLIMRALKEVEGNRTAAARRIGISRRTLHRKLKEYGLEKL
jgi:DNA-binding NtrC family response regulator